MSTIIEAIGMVVRAQPQALAVVCDGQEWSYAELWSRTEAHARGLLAAGTLPGEAVAILGDNSAGYLAAYLGVMRAGAVAVPVNTMLDVASMREALELVGARTVVTGRLREGIREGLEGDYRLVSLEDPEGGSASAPLPLVGPDSISTIMLTSGSTGRPKGVEQSHDTLFHAVTGMLSGLPFAADDRTVAFLPMFTCIPEAVLPVLFRGGTVEVLPGFDPERVADAASRATTFDAVPTVMARLLQNADLGKLARLRWILFASEPMPVPLLQSWWEQLPGVQTHQFYGMTELLTLSVASHDLLREEPRTVGRAFPHTRLRIDPLEGHDDGSGEILGAAPCRMRGYLGDPDATARALTDAGEMRTGDIGRLDERGLLFLTGRLKDIIISGGFNIAPAEIEAVALTLGSLQEVMVVGVPSARWGETPVVIGVPRAGAAVTPLELLEHCRTTLPGFKRPSAAALVPSLPTTGIGKGDKGEVRRLIAEGAIPLESL